MERGESEILEAALFGGFSTVIGAQLTDQTERISLDAGEWLFREGDRADHAYLVHSGRVEIVAEHPAEVVLRQVKRSEMLGEHALLMGGLRAASARASRDTELTRLSRAQFERLLAESPGFALGLLQAMATQISSVRAASGEATTPGTIAVVALDPAAPVARIGADLATAIAAHASVEELKPEADRDESEFRGLLKRTEARRQHVVLTAGADAAGDPWTKFCLREADVVIAVTTGAPAPEWLHHRRILAGCELLALDAPLAPELLALAPHEVQVMHGETALRDAIDATARRLAGRAVGLVLSGGGARAFAHLGVLEELEKTGIAIDRYAGVSLGALISGAAAGGADSGEMIELAQRFFVESNPSTDYTIPAYSLIRGGKTRRRLQDFFGERRIEELARRWLCVSADLVARELVVHRTGPIADAIYASLALPGVFPPVPTEDGRLLVDGGVIDNLPVETMARRAEGPIIAVDVTQRFGMPRPSRRPGLEGMARRMRRVLTGSEERVPRLPETISGSIALGSSDTVTAALEHADLVISPRVEGVGMLDWGQMPRAIEAGRRAAREALEAAAPQLESWTR